jgi:hypothetical protein
MQHVLLLLLLPPLLRLYQVLHVWNNELKRIAM